MNLKPILSLLLIAIVSLGVFVGGCSLAPKTGVDHSYYYPDWTPDGEIICIKKAEEWSETTPWPYGAPMRKVTSTKYYITTMSEEGTQETNIKQINSLGKVAASPLGNYIAYTEENYLKVITLIGGSVSSINTGDKIYSFDWSSDETKLVYNGSREAYVVNIDGSNNILIASSGASVSWRYGNKIIVDNPISSEVFRVIALESVSYSEIAQFSKVQGGEFNISKVNTNEVVYRSAYEQGIKRYDLSFPEAEPILLINRNDIWFIHLFSNSNKIIGAGDGSGNDRGKEIWIMNIDGAGIKQLK